MILLMLLLQQCGSIFTSHWKTTTKRTIIFVTCTFLCSTDESFGGLQTLFSFLLFCLFVVFNNRNYFVGNDNNNNNNNDTHINNKTRARRTNIITRSSICETKLFETKRRKRNNNLTKNGKKNNTTYRLGIIQRLFDISPGKHRTVLSFGVFYALFLINGVNSQCNGCANGHIENGSDCYNLINDRIYACRGEWSLPGISSIGHNSASLTCASNFEGMQSG